MSDREVYVLLEWKRGPYRTEVVEVELFLTQAKREEYARLRIGQVLQQDLFDPVRGLVESFLERGFLGDAVAQCCAAMACKRWLELWPSPLRVND